MALFQTPLFILTIGFTSCYAGLNEGNLGDLAKVFAMLAGGADCRLVCPGGVSPKIDPNHKPSSNGCGSHNIKFDVSKHPGFIECCNVHDICYDTCNSDRSKCDDEFKSCLTDACWMEGLAKKHGKDQSEKCKGMADLMHSGTVGLGCAAFKEAQRNACLCDGKKLSLTEMNRMEDGAEL